jgi:hypothetical protein
MRYIFFFCCVLFFSGCAQNKDLAVLARVSPLNFVNKWKLVEYENNQPVKFETIIEITNPSGDRNKFTINGKGPVNFFWMTCEFDNTTNTVKMGPISGTSTAISVQSQPVEDDLLSRFAECKSYLGSDDGQFLTFFNEKKTKLLRFKLNK